MKSGVHCIGDVIDISDDIITISDDVITISDDMIVVSSDSESIVNITDTSGSTVVGDGSKHTPSFDFDSSSKLLLQQPRTSTPVLQRSAVDDANKAKKREFLHSFAIFEKNI